MALLLTDDFGRKKGIHTTVSQKILQLIIGFCWNRIICVTAHCLASVQGKLRLNSRWDENHDVLWLHTLVFYLFVFYRESTYKKCLREEWGKFTGYQLLSSFWLKVARTDEDGNTTRWDRGTLPIRNLYPKWGMLRFGRIRKVTNWIWILWFIVSYWWAT